MRRLAFAVLLVPALAGVAPRGALAQRRGAGGHSRARGTGVPCGRSYISADKNCHVETPDVPTPASDHGGSATEVAGTAGRASAAAPGRSAALTLASNVSVSPSDPFAHRTASAALSLRAKPYQIAEEIAPVPRGAALVFRECTFDWTWCLTEYEGHSGYVLVSETSEGPRVPQAPEAGDGSGAAPVAPTPRAVHDERRVTAVPLEVRGGPQDRGAVLFTVPRRAVLEVHSCQTDLFAWCVASSRGHTGFFRRALLPSETATPADEYDERVSAYERPRTARAPRRAYAARSPSLGTAGGGHAGYYLGPRGGCYTYSASGRKRYVDHWHCR